MLYNKPKAWKDDFHKAIQLNDLKTAISIINLQRTSHAGTPPKAVKDQAIKLIRNELEKNQSSIYKIGIAFAESENDGAKELGIKLLAPYYAQHRYRISDILLSLADDPNWEVREYVAGALGTIINSEFELVYPKLKQWVAHELPNIRRAVAVGIGSAASGCSYKECNRLLMVLKPLLGDTDKYVSKNLGSFVIGDYLLRAHPNLVVKWLKTVNRSNNAQVRRNIAMSLSSAEAAKHLSSFIDILLKLAKDNRSVVQSATCKAVENLGKRVPNTIIPLLKEWQSDPKRSHVSKKVLPILNRLNLNDH